MNLETLPIDWDSWYKWAKKIDNTAKQTCVILGKTQQNSKTNKTGTGPCYFFPWQEHDPNAMDVDALVGRQKLYTHIRNIHQEMDEEERDKFLKQAEETGF